MRNEKTEAMVINEKKPLLWPLAAAAALIGLIICFGRKITFSGDVHASIYGKLF